jgi:hypothetical protein
MCTVSFIPRTVGFYLAMNRDEAVGRVRALPPTEFNRAGLRCLYPHEPAGGTWIGVNETGVCLALINGPMVNHEPTGEPITRGEVIRALVDQLTFRGIHQGLPRLPLLQMRPFRLIAASLQERSLGEWQWSGAHLAFEPHPWTRRHWFSSGFDAPGVERQRDRVCRQAAAEEASASNLAWLRRLHGSHQPVPSPYSICMHGPGAQTVSYTEVVVSPTKLIMRYQGSAPCQRYPASVKNLPVKPVRANHRPAPLPTVACIHPELPVVCS